MNSTERIPILFLTLALPVFAQAPSTAKLTAASPVADGVYMGLEPMPSDSPDRPDALWYHENTILVRNGNFILDENPIILQDGKKGRSASDGGFITYRGRFLSKNGRLYASRRPFMSDYVFFNTGPTACEAYSQVDIYPIKVTEQGFWISGVLYKATSVDARRLKELAETLNAEPLDYNGKRPYYSKRHFPLCKPNDLSVLDD
jgi:hypothetical protein